MAINQLGPLRLAVAVDRLGSFSAAARACGVSQPSASNAIADLERRLGVTLFSRSTRRVEATPAFRRLSPLIERTLDASDALEGEVRALVRPPEPELRIGFTPFTGASRIGALVAPFSRSAPAIKVTFHETSVANREAGLDAGRVDVAFGAGLCRHATRARTFAFKDALKYLPPRGVPAV